MRTAKAKQDSFCAYVLEQLGRLDAVESRAMFGGHGLYASGVFFGLVAKGSLYFRTDEESRKKYISYGMGPFKPSAKQTLRRYYEVPVDVLEDRDELTRWATAAIGLVKE